MSNFHFSVKYNNQRYTKKIVPSANYSNLNTNQNNNFHFNINNTKKSSCNSCPNDIKNINFENVNVKTLEDELNNAQKMLKNYTVNNEKLYKSSCNNCNKIDHIGFRIINNENIISFVCNSNDYLDISKDYHFENITILDKNDDYIVIDENMISNNSKQKLIINMTQTFYNDLRMPLVLNAECVLDDDVYYVHGFII
jgi:hypothetical protein